MGRIADATIKGFMYQFNLSLNEILKSADEVIKIEGNEWNDYGDRYFVV